MSNSIVLFPRSHAYFVVATSFSLRFIRSPLSPRVYLIACLSINPLISHWIAERVHSFSISGTLTCSLHILHFILPLWVLSLLAGLFLSFITLSLYCIDPNRYHISAVSRLVIAFSHYNQCLSMCQSSFHSGMALSRVHFTVDVHRQLSSNESVFVTGSSSSLGEWRPTESLPLQSLDSNPLVDWHFLQSRSLNS